MTLDFASNQARGKLRWNCLRRSSAVFLTADSEYLVDLVNRSVRASFANTDGDDAIQECVFFRRGLEPRHGAKVVASGIDGFAAFTLSPWICS